MTHLQVLVANQVPCRLLTGLLAMVIGSGKSSDSPASAQLAGALSQRGNFDALKCPPSFRAVNRVRFVCARCWKGLPALSLKPVCQLAPPRTRCDGHSFVQHRHCRVQCRELFEMTAIDVPAPRGPWWILALRCQQRAQNVKVRVHKLSDHQLLASLFGRCNTCSKSTLHAACQLFCVSDLCRRQNTRHQCHSPDLVFAAPCHFVRPRRVASCFRSSGSWVR